MPDISFIRVHYRSYCADGSWHIGTLQTSGGIRSTSKKITDIVHASDYHTCISRVIIKYDQMLYAISILIL